MFETMLGSMGMNALGGGTKSQTPVASAAMTGNSLSSGSGASGISMGSPVTIAGGGGAAWLAVALLAAVLVFKG